MKTSRRGHRRYGRNCTVWALAVLSTAALGCQIPGASRARVERVAATTNSREAVSWDQMLAESAAGTNTTEVRSVGYVHGIVAAPIAGLQHSDKRDQHLGVAMIEASEITLEAETTTLRQPVDYFIDLALATHPSIQSARDKVAAEMNRIPQARALPDPTLNNTFWPIRDQALQTAAGRVGHQMSLSQAVPWPEKLKTRAAIASREVQVAQAEVKRIERETVESVRLAYYELWYSTRAIAIVKETKQLINDLTKVAEARYRSGGTQQDVLRARLESDRLDEKLVELIRQKEAASADLAALVQQPATLMPETVEELELTGITDRLDDLISRAERCNPKLAGLAWEIQRDRQKHRLACLQKYPDLQFGVHWGLVDDDRVVLSGVANGHDMISFNMGTTLPIWRDKVQAGIREAAHRTNSTSRRLDAERDVLFGKLRRLLAQADALSEQRKIYEQRIIPRTEDTLKIAIADYRGRRTDFFSLVETYRELLMFGMQLARIDASLAGTLAQVERLAGCE